MRKRRRKDEEYSEKGGKEEVFTNASREFMCIL